VKIQLDPIEMRVLGSLVEKDLSTPDYYPMTLSAITSACNQKSNRDPVMSLGESQVLGALESLSRKNVAWEKGGAGGRVPRYAHKLSGTLSRTFEFPRPQLAVLGVLLLRGPQTPGELRARAARMHEFQSLGEVEETLSVLARREDGPYVAELAREPGRRERRHAHLFGDPADIASLQAGAGGEEAGGQEEALAERVAILEERVAALADELAALRRELEG
jgi:uncharacterized protein YceH (UPF0502 family)